MSIELKPHLCKVCGERRDSPSPLIICLGCAGFVKHVQRGEDGVCRCPDCQERVCGLAFDVASKAYASVIGAKRAVETVNQALISVQVCATGG